ncbi:hypothetical protein PG985_013221 [Apiospora marii]|uniref:Uncharacterized protein n=1 Tax=Apiospora marii TaxID=335849 RepID=A0ABR1RAC6_9PEZI
MGTTDEIGRAMATNTECRDEDSPTWPNLSPLSASLAAWRYPSGSESYEERNERENKLVQSIDSGHCPHQGKPGTCEPLGPTPYECVWSAEKIAHMTSGEVMIEARRRVRKWYTARYEAIRAELAADKDTSPEKADYRAQREQQAAELKKKIDAGLEMQKDEAMRRVMPILAHRWKE